MEASIWKRFLNVSKSIHISLNRSFTTLDTEQTSNFQAGGKIHHQNEIITTLYLRTFAYVYVTDMRHFYIQIWIPFKTLFTQT